MCVYKDKGWFDDQCRHAFGHKQETHLRWTRDRSRVNWEEFVCCQVKANESYSEAERQFIDRNSDVLMNVHSPHKRCSTLKSAVFGSTSSLPPFVSEDGGLVCESVGKADFMSSEVRRLLFDLDRYGGTDPLGMFPLFLKRTADVMPPPRLSVVFPGLLEAGECHLNSERSTVANYRPISITSVLSKVLVPDVCSSWTIYGTQWCASNHPVCL